MRLKFAAFALLVSGAVSPTAARTPAEDAQVKAVLNELIAIDEERDAIKTNAVEIDGNENVRREEIESLKLRYPGIVLPDEAKSAQMGTALWDFRQRRADTVRAIVERDALETRQKACEAYRKMESLRAQIEATDGYKTASLTQRMELRRSWEAFYTDTYHDMGDPCLPAKE
ncbi:MAG TPA: hypothetical protein VJM09_15965 [Sphingobium sp.]|nr:hypothetical protein [Sphingobium sp.]